MTSSPQKALSPLNTVIRGVRTILLANGFSKFLLLAIEFFVAFHLGTSSFGLYAITQSVIVLTAVFCLMGVNYGIIQHLAIYEENDNLKGQQQIILQSLTFLMITGVIGGTVLFFLKDFLVAEGFKKPELAPLFTLAVFIVPIDTISQGLGAIFRGLRLYRDAMLSTDLMRYIVLAIGVPLVILFGDLTLTHVFALYILGSLSGILYALYILYRKGKLRLTTSFDMTVLRSLFDFSYLLFVFHTLQIISTSLLIIGAGIFLTSAETGILGVGVRMTYFIVFFQTAVGLAVQTEFSRFQDKGDYQSQKDLFQNITRGLYCVAAAVALLFMVAPDYILNFMGEDYIGYGWVIWPLFLATFFNVVTGPLGQALIANKKQVALVKIAALEMILTLIFVLPAMKLYGLHGGILGESAKVVLVILVRLFLTYKLTTVHPFTCIYGLLTSIFIGCLTLGLTLNLALGLHPILCIASALFFYFLSLIGIIYKNKDMQDQLRTVLKF